ncbi:MAG: hypothetical protein QOI73_84, partial [Solirubrobacteraceae bacterium]|nr:hypothetical protein [Solirubrobacteraceae bacterium]
MLGALSIERGSAVNGRGGLPAGRAELVFAYLAAEHRRVVTRDELAGALWPDLLPDSWASALRGVVSEVRRYLVSAGLSPDDVLITESSGYRLRLPDDAVVDLDEARNGVTIAREGLSAGDGAGAAAAAGRAADLAGLPFLPHHDGEWADAIRDELAVVRAGALELLARAHVQAGNPRAAALAAERLVRAEPYSEAAHQLRIGVLGDADDRAGAIKAYEHCREVLSSELGVNPSAETEAVLRRALATAPAVPAAAAAAAAA